MLKFFLLAIGIIFLFEGLIYFLLASKIKNILKTINSFSIEKIKSFSTLLVIIGSVILYITFRIYEFN